MNLRRDLLAIKDGSEGQAIEPVAKVKWKCDDFSRVISLRLADLDFGDQWDDSRARISDALHYREDFDSEEPPSDLTLLWGFTLDAKGGDLVAKGRGVDYEEGVSVWGTIPPAKLVGADLRNWLEDFHPDSRLRSTASLKDASAQWFAHLNKSVVWLTCRLLREEPVLRLGETWEACDLVEENNRFRLSDPVFPYMKWSPERLVRVRLEPVPESIIQSSKRRTIYPEIELDLFVKADGFISVGRESFGRWTCSKSGKVEYAGLAALDERGELNLHGLELETSNWHSNLLGSSIADGTKFAIWRPSWKSSCGYTVSHVWSSRFAE